MYLPAAMVMYIANQIKAGSSATRINGQIRQRMRTPARILRTNSPPLTGITKPGSAAQRRPKTSSAHNPPRGTAATEALAEAMVDARKVVAAKKAAVVAAEVVAAGGDRDKQSTLLQG
jgi:hypothetical protein